MATTEQLREASEAANVRARELENLIVRTFSAFLECADEAFGTKRYGVGALGGGQVVPREEAVSRGPRGFLRRIAARRDERETTVVAMAIQPPEPPPFFHTSGVELEPHSDGGMRFRVGDHARNFTAEEWTHPLPATTRAAMIELLQRETDDLLAAIPGEVVDRALGRFKEEPASE